MMYSSSAHFELASISLACRNRETLLSTFADRVGTILGARGVLLWLNSPDAEGLACGASWTEPGEKFSPAEELPTEGLLAGVFESAGNRRLGKEEINAAQLEHLEEGCRISVKSALYAVIPGEENPLGVVELLNKQGRDFSAEEARFLEDASRLLGQALANLGAMDEERHANFSTLERLTALYDLGRTFTSTLEIEELLPIVAGKVRDIIGTEACNVWFVDAEANELFLAAQAGEDPTVGENSRNSLTEGLLAMVAQQANPKLVEEPTNEPDLCERQTRGGDFEFRSWMCAPLRKDDEVLGVLELVNKADEAPFDEDDLFFLASITEQATVALHNAN